MKEANATMEKTKCFSESCYVIMAACCVGLELFVQHLAALALTSF